MKYEIIRTNNYLLVVDGSEVTPLNWCLDTTTNLVFQYYTKREVKTTDKKIIAHLPLNGSSILEGVDLLPPLEDEVEKSAHIRFIGSDDDVNYNLRFGFTEGYNKAKENLHKILSDFYFYATDGEVCNHEIINKFIQSISQPKMPIGFECVTSPMSIDEIREQGKGFLNANTNKIKTATTLK